MKLLFLFYLPSGGMDTLNRQRCAALKQAGHNCQLLYLASGSGIRNNRGIPVHVTNEDAAIKALLDREQFDAIVVTSHYLMLPRLRALGFAGPLIYEAQGLGPAKTAQDVLEGAKPFIEAYADAVLYPRTPHLAELFRRFCPNHRHFSFHNCIDIRAFRRRDVPRPEQPIIGWVGRIETNKNWRQFLEIGYWLRRHEPALRLWMFVDDTLSTEEQAFREEIARLGLSDCLELHANVPHADMPTYYSMIGASGGLLLSTSLTEGFGYAVAEAMCCRTPVLCSDSDGIRSMVIHGATGRIYSGATDGVLQALEMLRSAEIRTALAASAHNHIAAHFAPELYAARFLHMLRELGLP